jgi:uncharacterized membrane protein
LLVFVFLETRESVGSTVGSLSPGLLAPNGNKDEISQLSRVKVSFPEVKTMVNPFDPKAALLAKHAQHVVLIHFPIALFISAVGFDLIARWKKQSRFSETAYWNLLLAAVSTIPVVASGVLAWQFQLEGQRLKGILLMHLVLAGISTALIWFAWWLHHRARRGVEISSRLTLVVELAGVVAIALTGHLGGFLSGVNLPG